MRDQTKRSVDLKTEIENTEKAINDAKAKMRSHEYLKNKEMKEAR